MKIDVSVFIPKKTIVILLTLFLAAFLQGQRHEIGVQLGMSNLVGDIGRTNYILQKPVLSDIADYGVPIYANLLYRMNFNPYQTVRLNLGLSNIQFIDALAKEKYRRDRKLWGTNSILEVDAIFEYNFFPVNDEQKSLISPYIFGGVGGMLLNTPQLTIENDFRRVSGVAQVPTNAEDFVTSEKFTSGKSMTMAIPFGVGLKYKFNYNWALFGEFMFRPTFSDSVDYSVIDDKSVKTTFNKDKLAADGKKSLLQDSPYLQVAEARAAQILQNRQIGNINSKDWVNTVSLGLSYSFGRPPCYCD